MADASLPCVARSTTISAEVMRALRRARSRLLLRRVHALVERRVRRSPLVLSA